MSRQLINRNADLKRLADEGYDIAIVSGHVVIRRIPYVTAQGRVAFGALAAPLELNAEQTIRPSTHVTSWMGEYPCDRHGVPLTKIQNQSLSQTLAPDLTLSFSFSSKPAEGYADYYEKMTAYARIISHPAIALDPGVTATPFPPPDPEPESSVFVYTETASARAGVAATTNRLRNERIGIIGVGGTGAYILDLVAKTPVQEIRLFDSDRFLQHNAYRCPGATSIGELEGALPKAELLAKRYGVMHRHVTAHVCNIEPANLDRLDGLTFVFVCIDNGEAKPPIFDYLLRKLVPFVDVGMGIHQVGDQLAGQVRVTAATPEMHDHLPRRVSYANSENDAYRQNIQIADLNMLNAALAVMQWKKMRGFYADPDRIHTAIYNIEGSNIVTEDCA